MTMEQFNKLEHSQAVTELMKCCTSGHWCQLMSESRPFESLDDINEKAVKVWSSLRKNDWLEAFDGHPKIGNVESLREKYNNTASMAGREQSGMNNANDEVINQLAKLNEDYSNTFGFIFIVCATGKSAQEMLEILKERVINKPDDELKIAANEQRKITKIRMEKILCRP